MIGLAGAYDTRASDDVLRRVVDKMCSGLATPLRPFTVAATGTDTVRCGVFQGDGRDCIARGSDLWLVFDGELYNRTELEQRRRDDDRQRICAESDAALCMALLTHEGDSFVRHLNGQFVIAIYRPKDARLSIATDRTGYRPLFLTHRAGRFLFATDIKAILAALEANPSIDGIGLLQSVRGGHALGNRTWVDGISIAEPGTWLHVDGAGCRQERYFRLRFHAIDHRDIADYAEGLATTLSRAVRRSTNDGRRFVLPLSGGLDSRAILLATGEDRRPAKTYTVGRDWSFDVKYAGELSHLAGVPHRHFRYEPGYLGRVLEKVVRLTGGLIGFAHATFSSFDFHDRIAEDGEVLLYGHAGDCLTGAHLQPSTLAARSVEGLVAQTFRLYTHATEPTLKRIFNQSFYRRHAGDLLDALRATFSGIEGERIADVADAWDMENRQRRGIFSSCAVDRYRFEVRAPFLDNDVVDHLCGAPLRWRFLQLGYKRMLVKSFSSGASVPWAHTGRRLRVTFLADLTQQSWNYAEKRLLRPGTDPREFRDLAEDTRKDPVLRQVLEDFVRHPQFPGDVFDRAGIVEVIHRHWSCQNDLTNLVIMLVTFATAWRLFLYEPNGVAHNQLREP